MIFHRASIFNADWLCPIYDRDYDCHYDQYYDRHYDRHHADDDYWDYSGPLLIYRDTTYRLDPALMLRIFCDQSLDRGQRLPSALVRLDAPAQ